MVNFILNWYVYNKIKKFIIKAIKILKTAN